MVNLDPGINQPGRATLGNPSASAITYDPERRTTGPRQPLERRPAAEAHHNMSLEAAYVGNRGVWEQQNGLVNPERDHARILASKRTASISPTPTPEHS